MLLNSWLRRKTCLKCNLINFNLCAFSVCLHSSVSAECLGRASFFIYINVVRVRSLIRCSSNSYCDPNICVFVADNIQRVKLVNYCVNTLNWSGQSEWEERTICCFKRISIEYDDWKLNIRLTNLLRSSAWEIASR